MLRRYTKEQLNKAKSILVKYREKLHQKLHQKIKSENNDPINIDWHILQHVQNFETLDQISEAVYRNAWDKGFHSEEITEDAFIESACNNLHNEISELHEAWRNNKLHDTCDKNIPLTCIEEEFADIIIRTLDNCKKLNVDIKRAIKIKHAYNKTRSHRHGNKRS